MNKEAKTGNYFFILSVTPHIFKLTSKNKVKELTRPYKFTTTGQRLFLK